MSKAPTMTKAHYEFIAQIIANEPDSVTCVKMAKSFAAELGKTNPNFDVGRFIDACVKNHDG